MTTAEIATLLDKQAITEVIYRYCRGLDRMDREMALSVWSPGATVDYRGMFTGTGEGFVDWVWEAHTALASHSHQISNILIDVAPAGVENTAHSEAYVTATLRAEPDPTTSVDIVARGRYLDEWTKLDGRWEIAHRIFVMDVQSMYQMPSEAVAGTRTGTRDRLDLSYDLFAT